MDAMRMRLWDGLAAAPRLLLLEAFTADAHLGWTQPMLPEFSLWRGDTLLGRFTDRPQAPSSSPKSMRWGILYPSVASTELRGIFQARFPALPDAPTLQHPMPPLDSAIRDSASQADRPRGVAEALNPLSPEAAAGVPRDQRLEVRSADGRSISSDLVTLQEIMFEPGDAERAGLPGDWSSAWMVSFAVPDEQPGT